MILIKITKIQCKEDIEFKSICLYEILKQMKDIDCDKYESNRPFWKTFKL